jgi:hypothetical protein
MTEATTDKPQTETPKTEEPKYVFPKFAKDDFGIYHMDKETLTFWVGVNVDPNAQDWNGACAFLDSMRHILWQWYKELARQMRMRQQLAVKKPSEKTGIFGLGRK